MKKISDQHLLDLRHLVDLYGEDALISELKTIGSAKSAGRPADLVLNIGIVWAHIEFLKLHRVKVKKKKLESACALLAGYLDRYTAAARTKSEVTLQNLYKRAPKAALVQPLVGLVMKDTYAVLLNELADAPHKVPIPYLIEGAVDGWKYPMFDTHQLDGCAEMFVHEAADYTAGLTWIVTPKNI
jgi:hypothetical protein